MLSHPIHFSALTATPYLQSQRPTNPSPGCGSPCVPKNSQLVLPKDGPCLPRLAQGVLILVYLPFHSLHLLHVIPQAMFRSAPFLMTLQRTFFFYMVEGWALLWLTKVCWWMVHGALHQSPGLVLLPGAVPAGEQDEVSCLVLGVWCMMSRV